MLSSVVSKTQKSWVVWDLIFYFLLHEFNKKNETEHIVCSVSEKDN